MKGCSVPAHCLGPSQTSPPTESMFPEALQEREGMTRPRNPAVHSVFYTVLPPAYFRVQSGTSFQARCTHSYSMCPLPASRRNA